MKQVMPSVERGPFHPNDNPMRFGVDEEVKDVRNPVKLIVEVPDVVSIIFAPLAVTVNIVTPNSLRVIRLAPLMLV